VALIVAAVIMAALAGAVAGAAATTPDFSKKALARALEVIGLEFTNDERELMLDGVRETVADYQAVREFPVGNSVPPALFFQPVPAGRGGEGVAGSARFSEVEPFELPANLEDLAFEPVTRLAALIRGRKITSTQLTKMYLDRLKRIGPKLEAVVTLTEDLALEQAARADREIADGHYRGPLHGIPWGAKDLLAAKGYPTTWGAMPYKDQVIDMDATVVKKLDAAGAVLVAKLTLGALAWGDVWYGGMTRNPWDLEEGSSGSSAGPAAATAAGLVGFAIGSETLGSIVSPSTRCGTTGLRPTFGMVSRHGAMALSWSMDKLGPICRTVEDCAIVFDAIRGPDGMDLTVVDRPFDFDAGMDVTKLRVGYTKSLFEENIDEEGEADDDDEERARRQEWRDLDLAALETLRKRGVELIPIELPADVPLQSISFILTAEAAAAFNDLTIGGGDDLLVRQVRYAWPNQFREARLIPAVEYIQANRIRTVVMQKMADLMETIDVYVSPTYGGGNLLLTNLTGHPSVVVPEGFRKDGTPVSITFTGKLYGEGATLAVARAFQEATDFHRKHPVLD
jgi:Asp-tRNA(Asn)/Glu-tRNA(Gln) amidotransferase A subunit family amidase